MAPTQLYIKNINNYLSILSLERKHILWVNYSSRNYVELILYEKKMNLICYQFSKSICNKKKLN